MRGRPRRSRCSWSALTAYAVLGGADFGAGFWDLTAGGAERGARVRGMVKRSMGPVWEANHVWLIFVLVVFWTGFPKAFGPVMETLYVPLFLAAVGIIFRGAAFALRGEAATIAEARVLGATFALSSVLVPFFFGATVGAIASGPGARLAGRAATPFSSWTGADLDLHRRARGGDRRVHGGGLPRRRRRSAPSFPTWSRPSAAARAGRGRRRRGAGDRRAASSSATTPRPLRRPHLRRRAGDGDRLGARRGW